MPIRINLLSEALAEAEMRRRDPVKRAILIGIFLVVSSLVVFSTSWLDGKLIQERKAQVEIEISQRADDYKEVLADHKTLEDGQLRLNALTQLSTNRFLQGNLLNALQKIYVPNVQLQHLRLEQSYTKTEGVPTTTNKYGFTILGRPTTITEHILLTLDARDTSSNAGDKVNPFKEALAAQSFFMANLDPASGVKLASLSSPQSTVGGKPYVLFTLECRFADKTR